MFTPKLTLATLVVAVVCLLSAMSHRADAQEPTKADDKFKELFKELNGKLGGALQKHGIYANFYMRKGGYTGGSATMSPLTKKSLDGLTLLQSAKVEYLHITAEISDVSLAEAFLSKLADFTNLKGLNLEIWNVKLQDKDVARIAELKRLEYLSLDYRDISPGQVKQLAGLNAAKALQYLDLTYTDPMSEALQELKLALPQAKTGFHQDVPRHMSKLVRVGDKDDPLTKLKKKKLLSAVQCINESHYGDPEPGSEMNSSNKGGNGRTTFYQLVQASKMLKEALAELDDRELTLEFADDYVRLTKQVRYNKDAPETEYLCLDAQIWQTKLQRAAKPGQ